MITKSVNFERGIDPKRAMGIGGNIPPYPKMGVKDFVRWAEDLIDPFIDSWQDYANIRTLIFADNRDENQMMDILKTNFNMDPHTIKLIIENHKYFNDAYYLMHLNRRYSYD